MGSLMYMLPPVSWRFHQRGFNQQNLWWHQGIWAEYERISQLNGSASCDGFWNQPLIKMASSIEWEMGKLGNKLWFGFEPSISKCLCCDAFPSCHILITYPSERPWSVTACLAASLNQRPWNDADLRHETSSSNPRNVTDSCSFPKKYEFLWKLNFFGYMK